MIALFDRAEARDFADVHALAARYGTARLLELAAAVDRGFDEKCAVERVRALFIALFHSPARGRLRRSSVERSEVQG